MGISGNGNHDKLAEELRDRREREALTAITGWTVSVSGNLAERLRQINETTDIDVILGLAREAADQHEKMRAALLILGGDLDRSHKRMAEMIEDGIALRKRITVLELAISEAIPKGHERAS